MKKLTMFCCALNILLNTTFVQATALGTQAKEQKITVKASIKPVLDMKIARAGSSALIENLSLTPSLETPLLYETSQAATISTLGYDSGHRFKISLSKELVLELTKKGQKDEIRDARVLFKGQDLTVNNPIEFTPDNNKIEGLLKIIAKVTENQKVGVYSGELILKVEEVA
ncbi:hypothetical protein [Candidatus Williamhamiltonella defendens]|uniref:Fimbrial protein n=1 Tax=Candidatus Hamiltonella defensa (Bemisia tabaci) TaxID=672795 RepID=A0A249DY83_9ENTR|nr:hypothetical protein [Candidatus Hamiltonella defensa]ASX26504.1 hypothetical protein BA171_05440 [Candidatus Hamiltonella defensa (Bemisia tabaci)]